MPPIYRHIVPTVPALTAGNGKPCYRGGSPVYKQLMDFSVVFGGTIDVQPWLDDREEDASEYRDPTITSAELNEAMSHIVDPLTNMPYNKSRKCYSDGVVISGDGGVPSGNRAAYISFDMDLASSGGYAFTQSGVVTKSVVGIGIETGLTWDGADTSWRWYSRVYELRLWFYLVGSNDRYHVAAFSGGHTRYPYYAAAASTSDIRVGAGVTMPFSQVYNNIAAYAWRDAALANSALVVSAQYA